MKLVFLTYINRSGSSFLVNELSKHREIFVLPEAEILLELTLLSNENNLNIIKNNLYNALTRDKKLSNYNINNNEIEEVFIGVKTKTEVLLNFITKYKNKHKAEASIIIFKNRDIYHNYEKIYNLTSSFVQTYLISIIRDPRNIFYSQKTTINPYNNRIMNKNPLVLSYLWNNFIKITSNIENKITVKYEDLIYNPSKELEKILVPLSINSINNSEDTYYSILPEIEKQIRKNINKEPDIKKLNNWKDLSNTNIKFIESITKSLMIENRYKPLNLGKIGLVGLSIKLYYKIRLFFSIDKY